MEKVHTVYSRYLRYWWIKKSQIDPAKFLGKYYHVFYDRWGRYIWIEEYDESHSLIHVFKFVWKTIFLTRTVSYSTNGEMIHYTLHQRNWCGMLLKMERYFPDGTISPIYIE